MLASCISAMYGAVAGASTKLGCVSSVTIASLRRGGFAGRPDLRCESTGWRECSAKSVAKMILAGERRQRPTPASVTPRKVEFQDGAQFERATTNIFDR